MSNALTHEMIYFTEIWTASFQISCVSSDHKHSENIQLMIVLMSFPAFSRHCLKVTNYNGSGVIFSSTSFHRLFFNGKPFTNVASTTLTIDYNRMTPQVVITSTLIIKKKGPLVYFHVRSRHSAQRGNQENGNQYARPGFQRDEGIFEHN